MVKLLCGIKGTGKTKKMIDMANHDSESAKGDIVFIESSNRYLFDLKSSIRYINAMEFDISSVETFHGFLCGLIAEDYDIDKIYIDGLYKIVDLNFNTLSDFINTLDKLSDNFNVDFIMSVNHDPIELPENLKSYVI